MNKAGVLRLATLRSRWSVLNTNHGTEIMELITLSLHSKGEYAIMMH